MTPSELKNKIIRQVEYFDENQLVAFYDVLLNFISEQNEIDSSSNLNQEEKDGNSISNTEVVDANSHAQAIREMRAKYRH